nr:unnamed protein product [Callosobruchus chinensis]
MKSYFYDIDKLGASLHLTNKKKNTTGQKVNFRDNIKWFRINEFGSYLYKESLHEDEPFMKVNILKTGSRIVSEVEMDRLEEKRETEETAITQTVNFINNQLKVKVHENIIRHAYRIGKKQEGQLKFRPLVVEFLNYTTKQSILISAKKLPRGCGFYITNDYTQEEYNKRKVLYSHLRKAREDHNSAYIKNNILYVNGGQYSYEDLETDTTEEDDVTSGEYQQGTQNREIGDHIQSSRKNTLETKKREEKVTKDLRYPKTKDCTQKGLSSTSSLLRNTPPKLRSNSSSAKV